MHIESGLIQYIADILNKKSIRINLFTLGGKDADTFLHIMEMAYQLLLQYIDFVSALLQLLVIPDNLAQQQARLVFGQLEIPFFLDEKK